MADGLVVGGQYKLLAGHTSVRGKMATVLALDPEGGKGALVKVGLKEFRCRQDSLEGGAGSVGVGGGGASASAAIARAPRGRGAQREVGPGGRPAAGGQKLTQYQKRKLRQQAALDAAGERSIDRDVPVRSAAEVAAAAGPVRVPQLGQWPMVLPAFTLDEVKLTRRVPGPTFTELWQVDLPRPLIGAADEVETGERGHRDGGAARRGDRGGDE